MSSAPRWLVFLPATLFAQGCWTCGAPTDPGTDAATGTDAAPPPGTDAAPPCVPEPDGWCPTATAGASAGRWLHTAVWTGAEMIVWGGLTEPGGMPFGDGARYDPARDAWTPVSMADAPSAREGHVAVWTGTEMIVWGGLHMDGARYDPTADSWGPINLPFAPSARWGNTVVWTGNEMIVWGGCCAPNGSDLQTGGRYDPASDSWAYLAVAGAPSGRIDATAVWSGSEMLVWGGADLAAGFITLGDGGRYDPATDSWTAITPTGAPEARCEHTAVWSGTEMLVWGGISATGVPGPGGRYDPAADAWTALSSGGSDDFRFGHDAVWTGSEMLVWGGEAGAPLGTVARYDPVADTWTTGTLAGAPADRAFVKAVWSGTEMIVWGGFTFDAMSNAVYPIEGGRYAP